jgi:7-keto-8-aminopelargonate synthetase-like enzyme
MIALDSGVSNYIQMEGRRYSLFSGNNYLGLSSHPALKKAARESLEKYGLNAAAARQTTGTTTVHLELEKELSDFKHQEDTVVFASGYMGNGIMLHALRDQYNAVFIDEAGHPSIFDGIPRDIHQVHRYKHCNLQHLEDLLKKHRNVKPLIISDGIFALTGEIAPLDELHSLAVKYGAVLVLDDAHATGVLGKNGTGTPEYFNLQDTGQVYQTDTMSKAMGVYGGFISSSKTIINRIRESSMAFLASTALPPPIASAACTSVRIIREHPGLRAMLSRNADEIRKGITSLGLQTSGAPTPIIPIYFSSLEKARQLSDYLKENGMIVPCVQYPVFTDKFIVRITVSAVHTMDQIEELIAIIKQWNLKHGVT